MSKVSVYIATSLDGFIARKDGDIEWLHNSGHGEADKGEDFGYADFMGTVDALVMGRHSYEKVLSFGGDWPYGKTPVFVLTSKGVAIPDEISHTVSELSGSPREIVDELEAKGFNHLYLDGGKTIQRFLESGLVDQLIITRIPVLLGEGIPLFGSLSKDVLLKHIETSGWPNGFVQSRYQVRR